MQNPKKQLSEYLDRLIHRFLYTKRLHLELKRTLAWRAPKKIEVINLSFYFFELATYSISRTILVELASLLSSKEERSLVNWLKKAKDNAAALEPSIHNPTFSGSEREPVSPVKYGEIIDDHLGRIASHQDLIYRIKSWRDKAIAHMDKEYFEAPKAMYKDYPLTRSEIDTLLEEISEILRKHHSLLFQSDLTMEIFSDTHVDVVLRYARAHMRARRDKDLIKRGYRPADYERE